MEQFVHVFLDIFGCIVLLCLTVVLVSVTISVVRMLWELKK